MEGGDCIYISRSEAETSVAWYFCNRDLATAEFASWRETLLTFAASRHNAPEPVIETLTGAVLPTEQVIVGTPNDAVQVAFMKTGSVVMMQVLNQNLPEGLLGNLLYGDVRSGDQPQICSGGLIYICGKDKSLDKKIATVSSSVSLKSYAETIVAFNAEYSLKTNHGVVIDEACRIRIEVL